MRASIQSIATGETMTPESALTFFIAIFIFGITPGPGVFALLSRTLASGRKGCFSLALGMTVSDVIYLILACFGLATLAENWSGLFTLIRYAGAAYLLYLAWQMWTAANAPVSLDTPANVSGPVLSFVQGFLISASNPKVILFYIAFLPTFMDLTRLTAGDIAIASALTVIALMLGLMMIVYSAASAREKFQSPVALKFLNRIAGGVMGAAGIFLASRTGS
jgi:threonine/homoserine/homoserine lactone efflux protein